MGLLCWLMLLLVDHFMHIMILLDLHLFNYICSFHLFIKQHICISRLCISTTTKALTFNNLLQIYLWYYPVIKLKPLLISLYIRIVMTSLCTTRVNQNTTKLVTMWVLYLLIIIIIFAILWFLFPSLLTILLLDLHFPLYLLLVHELLQWELSQIQIHREL